MASHEWLPYWIGSWHCLARDFVCITLLSSLQFALTVIRCQQDATGTAPSIVSGTAVSTGGRTEWQVVAHEIGHNFGAIVSTSTFYSTIDC